MRPELEPLLEKKGKTGGASLFIIKS